MAYTGNPDSPSNQVRFLVGDTNPTRPLLSDGEVAYALEQKANVVKAAAAMLARQIAGTMPLRYTGYKLADYSDPDGSKLAAAYIAIASRLESELVADLGAGGIYAGGISKADKEMVESNTDRVQPAFAREMFDIGSADRTE